MHPLVKKLSDREMEELDPAAWPVTTIEIARYSRHYDQTEEYLILQGEVELETDNGPMKFGPGDFVTFPEGTSCVWDVKEPVVAHHGREGSCSIKPYKKANN